MRRFALGISLIGLGIIQLLSANAGRADAPTKVGWWNEAQQAPAPAPTIPAPPTSPDGGITVTNTPNGPAAWGAVSYPVGDITGATLKLTSSTPIQIPSGDGLLGCLVDTPGWKAGGNQRWDTKPVVDPLCTPGKLDSTGMVVQFNLTAAFRDGDGAVDIATIPTGQLPFTVNFDAPSKTSLTTVAAASSGNETTATTVASSDAFVPGEIVNGSTLLPDPSQFAFATPPSAPASAPPEQALGGYGSVAPVLKTIEHPRKERIAMVVIIVGILLSLWRLAGMTVRAPRLLGSLGADEPVAVEAPQVGGIGRFARTREDRPRRLA